MHIPESALAGFCCMEVINYLINFYQMSHIDFIYK